MRKLWLNVDINQLRPELGLGPDNPPARARPPQPGAGIRRGAPDVAGAVDHKQLQCTVHSSLPDAEDAAEQQVRVNPQAKILIFVATAFFEPVPSVPIRKQFNEVGELVP